MSPPIVDINMESLGETSGSDHEEDANDASRTLLIYCTRSGKGQNGDMVQDFQDMDIISEEEFVQDNVTIRTIYVKKHVMPKTALVILAEGSEEMEAIITVDVLRRGGVLVTLAGLDGDKPIKCSRDVTLVPDKSLADALAETMQYDAVILPGGLGGTERFIKSDVVGNLLRDHEKSGKIIAAICAAPTAFAAHGVAQNKRVTSYPSLKERMTGVPGGYVYVEGERVVVDGNVVTSRGPGTAYWFGLTLLELLTSKDQADSVEKAMILTGY